MPYRAPSRPFSIGMALFVVLWCLYFPFLGLLGIGAAGELGGLLLALPGFFAGAAFHPNGEVMAAAAGLATVAFIIAGTFIARRGYRALIVCAALAFAWSTATFVVVQAIVRM